MKGHTNCCGLAEVVEGWKGLAEVGKGLEGLVGGSGFKFQMGQKSTYIVTKGDASVAIFFFFFYYWFLFQF